MVVVHCECFVECETLFTSYPPLSLYLVQLSVTFVTRSKKLETEFPQPQLNGLVEVIPKKMNTIMP